MPLTDGYVRVDDGVRLFYRQLGSGPHADLLRPAQSAHVNRVMQIGAMQPHFAKQYPAHLTAADGTPAETFAKLTQLQKDRGAEDPVEFCKKFWALLRVIYVANPAAAGKINWSRCDALNELNFMQYWTQHIIPSIQKLKLTPQDPKKSSARSRRSSTACGRTQPRS